MHLKIFKISKYLFEIDDQNSTLQLTLVLGLLTSCEIAKNQNKIVDTAGR